MGEGGPQLGGVTGVGGVVERGEPVDWEGRGGARLSVLQLDTSLLGPLLLCKITTTYLKCPPKYWLHGDHYRQGPLYDIN